LQAKEWKLSALQEEMNTLMKNRIESDQLNSANSEHIIKGNLYLNTQ
jgi:hypothetical protein